MAGSASDEKAELAAPGIAPAARGGGKLVMILSIVNTVAVVAMAAILLLSFERDKKRATVSDISTKMSQLDAGAGGGENADAASAKDADKKKNIDFGKMVALEQFTVNLSTPGSVNPKFVRVNISLEVPTEDLENEVNSRMPEVRNVIIDLFNSRRPADLETSDQREYLKEEIRNAINGFLVHGKLSGVFFTNFAMTS